jgi:hypothetical protein
VARPKTNRTPEQLEATAGAVNDSALELSGAALDAQAQQLAVADQLYGLGGVYERESHVRRLMLLRQEVGTRLLEAGLLLLQMKEREQDGQFYAECTRAGYQPRFARKLMQAARSFGADPLRRQLADKLGIGKVLELITEDDEDIDALAQGGELHGLTADEFARMTKRDVIALLKREREEAEQEREATDEVMRKKDERINKLAKEKRIVAKSGPRAQVDSLLGDLAAATVEVATSIKLIRDTASAIQAAYAEAGQPLDEEVAQQLETNLETARGWAEALTEELAQV